ncbi:MAG TPA: hypothetical protein VJ417_15110, partial [Candidatus Glassbacteria bacterium]|nr:hypothetical protein [Candidatus Glassbacteria bacterium]
MVRKISSIAGLLVAVAWAVVSAQGRPLEFDDLLRVRRISSPAVSPDGHWVAFVQTTYDLKSYEASKDIYLVPLTGGSPRAVTTGGKGNSDPMFTADGSALVFASTRHGSRQFYRLPLAGGGEAVRLTDFPGGTSGGALSPDDKYLLFHAEVLVDSASVVTDQGAGAPRARIIDKLMFRHWDHWRNGRYSHLFIKRLDSDDPPLDLTPGPVDCPPVSLSGSPDYAFDPQGRWVYYVANRDPVVAVSTNNDIWRVNLDGTGLAKLTANPANDNLTAPGPEGKYLAYLAMQRPGFESDRACLWLRELESGRAVNLTYALDCSVSEVVWDPRSKFIYLTGENEGKVSVFRVNAGFEDQRRVERLTASKTFGSIA